MRIIISLQLDTILAFTAPREIKFEQMAVILDFLSNDEKQ